MPKKKKTAAGAPPPKAAPAEKPPKKKRRKAKDGAPPQPPPQAAAPPAPQRHRAQGGVPPPQAFDNLRRLGPPNLAGPDEPPPQRTLEVAEGGKAQKEKKPEPKKNGGKTANFARKRLRRHILAGAALLALLGVGVWLTVTMLFKIESFEVQGDCPYTVEEMQAAFGVAPGVAMYGFSVDDARKRMLERLPYLESVDIHRSLPSTIRFQAEVAREVYAVPWEAGCLVLSDTLKVLRQADGQPEGLTVIEGLSRLEVAVGKPLALAAGGGEDGTPAADSAAPQAESLPAQTAQVPPSMRGSASSGSGGAGEGDAGENTPPGGAASVPEVELPPEVDPALYYDADESFHALPVLLKALADCGLTDITWVDVSDAMDLKFQWEARITVRLGTRSGLADKLDFVVSLLDSGNPDGVSVQARGTLDMGLYLITRQGVFSEE